MQKLSRFVSLTVSTSIFLMSPGFGSYRAFAQTFAASNAASQAAGKTAVPMVPQSAGIYGSLNAAPSSLSGSVGLASVLPGLSGANISLGAARTTRVLPAAALKPVGAIQGAVQGTRKSPAARVSGLPGRDSSFIKSHAALRAGVKAELANVGPIATAEPGKAYAAGGNLSSLLSGGIGRANAGDAVAPVAGRMGRIGNGVFFANPAGKDSIAAAVRAQNGIERRPERNGVAENGSSPKRKSPFLPKLFAAGLGLLPLGFLAFPLLSGGAFFAGAAVAAGSVALMSLPFMTGNTPEFARSLPGVVVGALGVFTALSGVLTGHGIVMGLMVALGGWGLYRWGKSDDQDQYYDREKILTSYFGALAAVAGAGLMLAGPGMVLAGSTSVALAWTLKGLSWAAYPVTALLFMHLPEWVGEGMSAAFRGGLAMPRAVHRVLGSLKRDTVLRERLVKFTERHLRSSKWNAIWLGGIWIPVWISEGAMFLLAAAAGLAIAAAQAPLMFVWGAAHNRAQNSRNNKFMAAWNRFIFENGAGSKVKIFNRFEKILIPYANSRSKFVSWPAAAAIRVGQLAWLSYVVAGFVPLAVLGFFRAFARTAGEYDPAKHSPSRVRVDRDDVPDVAKPDEPDRPGAPKKTSFFPRLIASAVGLAPMYFFGLPLIAQTPAGVVYAAVGIALALMPFIPQRAPKAVRVAPGYLLTALGLLTAFAVPYFTFTAGAASLWPLVTSNAFWMGAVAALSGWGLIRYTNKLETEEKWYSVEDPEYIGAYFGAIGVTAGVGLALLGPAGWALTALQVGTYLTSLLLLMHLPRWVGTGVQTVFTGAWKSVRSFHGVFNFWSEDTRFYKSLKRHSRYWLDKSIWNGAWLSAIWVPTWIVMLGEFAAAGLLGLAAGLVRAPLNFLWGASYRISPDSRWTRFIAGVARTQFRLSEGSKDGWFKALTGWLWKAMDERTAGSGRPTLKAAAAFLVARVLQAAWLAAVVLGQPVIFLLSLIQGIRAASGEKKKPDADSDKWVPDQDDPDNLY